MRWAESRVWQSDVRKRKREKRDGDSKRIKKEDATRRMRRANGEKHERE